jgi:hypothetical protein
METVGAGKPKSRQKSASNKAKGLDFFEAF